MPNDHQRDLSLGSYLLIGSLVIGVELVGFATTVRIGLCIAGLAVAVGLAVAAVGHLRSRRGQSEAARLRAAVGPREQVGRNGKRSFNTDAITAAGG